MSIRSLVSSTWISCAPSTFCLSFIAKASSLFCKVKLSTGSANARLTMKPVTNGMPARVHGDQYRSKKSIINRIHLYILWGRRRTRKENEQTNILATYL